MRRRSLWLRLLQRELRSNPAPYRFGVALIVALVLHVFLFFALSRVGFRPSTVAAKPIRVHTVPSLPKDKPSSSAGQVVAVEKPRESERPEKSDFRSEFDRKVDRETQAYQKSPFAEKVTSKPQPGQAKSTVTPSGTPNPLAHIPMRKSPTGRYQALDSKPRGDLVPSVRQLAQMGGMPFNDNLKDVEIGAETRLNTWEWKHATFFNRVKEAIARSWDPRTQIRRFDPGGVQLGRQDRITIIHATLDKSGNLVKVEVEKPSGVDYLDKEALHAFQEAAPFLHPPAALFSRESTFSFSFGFHLSLERGFGLGFD